MKQALGEAFRHPSYVMLVLGFFTCGFQLAFVTVHFQKYVVEGGISPEVGYWAYALVGIFNIIGSISVGALTNTYPRRWLLSTIYFSRSVVILIFILLPPSPVTVVAFSVGMGVLWLSTVPPTQGLVAVMFGTRYMATLLGIAFITHQVGSFLGAWGGGMIFTVLGSYDRAWQFGVAIGTFQALQHRIADMAGQFEALFVRTHGEHVQGVFGQCAHIDVDGVEFEMAGLEFRDPETLRPVADGEKGELVVTALSRTLMPMVRFRTGDLAVAERREGLTVLPRGVFGRTDQMVKVKGVKLYPTELAPVLAGFGLDPKGFQVVVERKLEGTDKLVLRLKAEKVPPGLFEAIQKATGLKVDEVELVETLEGGLLVDRRF